MGACRLRSAAIIELTSKGRIFGNVLGNLPADSVNTARIGHAFTIPRVPCQIALRTPQADRLRVIANEVLNPFCSEDSWVSLASALGEMTHQPIVRGTAERQTAEVDFDGMGALKDDDDDEGKSKPGEPGVEPISVDFNLLSRVMAGLRPADAFVSWRIGIALLSGSLILSGLTSFVLPFRSEPKAKH